LRDSSDWRRLLNWADLRLSLRLSLRLRLRLNLGLWRGILEVGHGDPLRIAGWWAIGDSLRGSFLNWWNCFHFQLILLVTPTVAAPFGDALATAGAAATDTRHQEQGARPERHRTISVHSIFVRKPPIFLNL
jgi:hypothetical protein